MDIIRRGASEIIPEEELLKKLERSVQTQKPLNIKLGCDPSRPDLHIGHAVVLRKLAQFQELGHQAILIIGDFTGMIGDPTGRNQTRPSLSLEDTRKNGESYFEQASKILDRGKTKIVYNSEWLGKMSFEDVIKLASRYTVARMLERDDFTKRFRSGEPISIHEFLYPLAQAMDSVAIESDVELGGTDQKFNLLVGRDIQREFNMEPQVILTMPLLVGTDGVEKMSKSYGNYIGISDAPNDMYGKTLSIPDTLIYNYYSMYYSPETGQEAEDAFDRLFIKKEIPDDIPEMQIALPAEGLSILELLSIAQLAPTKTEARRLIQQGGVSVNGEKISDANALVPLQPELIVKVGKRKFLKIITK
ncbi:MAG: tyrosine--tRNA ligase [Ignavibacteriales bacterium]|nr:tyrosine--tRNA ligase [Ignavibacteriales bacterium]